MRVAERPGRHFKQADEASPRQGRAPVERGGAAANARGRHAAGPAQLAHERTTRREPLDAHQRTPEASRARRVVSAALIVVGVALLIAALVIFVRAQLGYREAEDAYADLERFAAVEDTVGDGVPAVDFDELAAINPDVVGWIYIPGTAVNYPVVQAEDNTTYLYRLFDGRYNTSGTVFLDCDNQAPGGMDEQTSIYGHHMFNGGMFEPIDRTQDQAAFDAIEAVYYITRDATYRFEPLATTVVDDDYLAARTPNFTGAETLADYLGEVVANASAKADDAEERAGEARQVLTLITCSDDIVPSPRRAIMVCTLA